MIVAWLIDRLLIGRKLDAMDAYIVEIARTDTP